MRHEPAVTAHSRSPGPPLPFLSKVSLCFLALEILFFLFLRFFDQYGESGHNTFIFGLASPCFGMLIEDEEFYQHRENWSQNIKMF